jgi:5'-3' exonuclease
VEPKQVPDFIALRGDPSDKLPGAPGVGAQGAAALLRRYGSLNAILKAGRFARIADDLRLYRAIATTRKRRCRASPGKSRPSPKPPSWRANGSFGNWRAGWRR